MKMQMFQMQLPTNLLTIAATLVFRDGSEATVDENGHVDVPQPFVVDMVAQGLTMIAAE
jgi:hypothetical protein